MRTKLEHTKSDRRFQLWEYLVSLGQLLIRSPKSGQVGDRPAESTNVDLIFTAVEYIGLPHSMNGFELTEATPEEDSAIRRLVGKNYLEKLKVYAVISEGKRFHVMGLFAGLWENDWELFESPLDFHHRSRAANAAKPIYSLTVDISAPAEWVLDNGRGPFEAVLVAHTPDSVLVKLLSPVLIRNSKCSVFLASMEADSFDLEFGRELPCKFTPMRDMELFSVDSSEATETAKRWAKFEKASLEGSVQVLNSNPRYRVEHL